MKTWPIIRHIRWYICLVQVNRHYAMWRSLGYLPVNAESDYQVLDKIWQGEL
jgi:hypothetical protein